MPTKVATDFPVDHNSVVVDLGAYLGDWSAAIWNDYHPAILQAYEPVTSHYDECLAALPRDERIAVRQFGLGPRDEFVDIALDNDASSAYRPNADASLGHERIVLRRIDDFLPPLVDLLKVNIEGAEFDLFDHMIANDLVGRCRYMLIQWHSFMPDAAARLATIETGLLATHDLVHRVDWKWDRWERRD